MNERIKKYLADIVLIAVMLVSIVVCEVKIAPWAASPDNRSQSIEYLTEKRNTVMALATASATASTALTLIPDDVATPIANELADLSVCFLIILAAIYLEKYLVTISGLVVFRYIIPLACLLYILYRLNKQLLWTRQLALKLAAFGLAVFMLVPASVELSSVIDETYGSTIQETITAAEDAAEIVENGTEEEKTTLKNLFSGIKDTVSSTLENIKNILNNFIESIAVMIVTACIIPVLVMLAFIWLINTIFGLDIKPPLPPKMAKHFPRGPQSPHSNSHIVPPPPAIEQQICDTNAENL